MPLKELLTKEYSINDFSVLFHADKFLKKDRLRFVAVERSIKLLPGERQVVLVPLRTLTAFPFSFPFGKKVSVRNALELRFRPLLGTHESNLNLITQITKQKANETAGVAWYVSKDETEQFEREYTDSVIWPAPLAFVSRVKGNGIVVCSYDNGCCGMVFVAGEPKLYRWQPKEHGNTEQFCEELVSYVKKTFETEPDICIVAPEKEPSLQATGDKTVELYPYVYNLNLSSVNLSAKAETDMLVDKLSRLGQLMTVLGVIFLLSSLMLLGVNGVFRSSFAEAPSLIYEMVLGEKSGSPLSSVSQKLRLLNVASSGQDSFETHINRISSIWKELQTPPVFDEMRYSLGRIQVSGIAAGASEIDALRKALADNGYEAVTEQAQQMPKVGMRFTISLTNGKKQ